MKNFASRASAGSWRPAPEGHTRHGQQAGRGRGSSRLGRRARSLRFDVRFFTEIDADRHTGETSPCLREERVHYVSICSPNYPRRAHAPCAESGRALRPLVINPWNLDGLQEARARDRSAHQHVLQLRVPTVLAFREAAAERRPPPSGHAHLRHRARTLCDVSWKGSDERSGASSPTSAFTFRSARGSLAREELEVPARCEAGEWRPRARARRRPLVLSAGGRSSVFAGTGRRTTSGDDGGWRTAGFERLHRSPHARVREVLAAGDSGSTTRPSIS